MKLYGYWRSSASWRVRIGLGLKGLPYEYVAVHLKDGVQHSDAHRARSPMAQIPVLEWDEGGAARRLTQSLAILEYLDELHPEPPLLPSDPYERARARQFAEVVNAGIQPLQNFRVGQELKELGGDYAVWSRRWIQRGLEALEALAARDAGAFLVGDAPSLADLCLIPQLYNARRFGCDLQPLPTLLRVEAACEAIPAFQAAHPSVQPDAQP